MIPSSLTAAGRGVAVRVGGAVGPGRGVECRLRFRGDGLRVFGARGGQHVLEVIRSAGLENGLIRGIEEVHQARAQVVQARSQAGVDRGQEIQADQYQQGGGQQPDTSKFLGHGEDYIS